MKANKILGIALIIIFIMNFMASTVSMAFNELESVNENTESAENINANENNETENNDLLRISCRCNNGNSQNLLTINSDCLGTTDDNSGNSCGCGNNNDIAVANNRCYS